jgi:acetyl esterase
VLSKFHEGTAGVGAGFRDECADVERDGGSPRPHEQVRAFLASTPPPLSPWSAGIDAVRADVRERVLAVTGALRPVASVEAIEADGVPGRLYRPSEATEAVLVWAHGGGWTHGDLDTCEGVARALANRAGCAVLAVDYRLAPEHPFPAGFEDVWRAIEWAKRTFTQVAVGGDSSGGNLAAAAALKARDRDVELTVQLLVYPVLDSTQNADYKLRFTERYATFAGQAGYGRNTYDRLRHIWATYAPDPALRTSPYASPMHAHTLRGVAPAVIITAEHDFLRGEAEAYARRLAADGVNVKRQDYAGQIHGFFEMFDIMTDAHHAVGVAGDGLRRAFQPDHPTQSPKEFSCDR